MHHAMEFRRGVPVDEAHIPDTTEVHAWSNPRALSLASAGGRLRCPGCEGHLTFVERSDSDPYFSHRPFPDDDLRGGTAPEDCPFRSGNEPGKVAETLWIRKLQRDRPAANITSLSEVRIDPSRPPIEVRVLMQDDELPRSEVLDRTDGRPVVFIIFGWHLWSFDAALVDALLADGRLLVFFPAEPPPRRSAPGAEGSTGVPRSSRNEISIGLGAPVTGTRRYGLDLVDIVFVEWSLLGIGRPATPIFILTDHAEALRRLTQDIEGTPPDSPVRLVYQSLIEIVLVEGAHLNRSVVGDSLVSANGPLWVAGGSERSAEDVWSAIRVVDASPSPREVALVRSLLDRLVIEMIEAFWTSQTKLQEMAAGMEALRAANSKLERDLQEAEEETSALRTDKAGVDSQLREERGTIEALRTANADLDRQLKAATAESETLRADKANLARQLEAAETRIQTQQETLALLERERVGLRETVQEFRRHRAGRRLLRRCLSEEQLEAIIRL